MIALEPCEREQEVLLAMHSELGPVRRFLALCHVAVCPSCRRRRSEFARVAAALGLLRPVTLSPATNAVPVWRRPLTFRSATGIVLALIAAGGIGAYAYKAIFDNFETVTTDCSDLEVKPPPPERCE